MNTQDVKENIHTMIDSAFAEMDELKNKAARSTADLRKKFQSELQALEVKKQELETRMADMRRAAEHKREELEVAVEESATSFRESLERMASVFGDEPAIRK